MLARALQSAAKAQTQIEYVGSVTRNMTSAALWDSSGEALDVFGAGATTGDLVVIAFSFDFGEQSSFTWNGMSFTSVLNATNATNPGAYAGYRFVQPGDSNPYVTGASGNWEGLTVVASIFRNVSSFSAGATSLGSTGDPDPPLLSASGNLYVITGHLDDDSDPFMTAPTNYTLSGRASGAFDVSGTDPKTTTAIAHRIEALSSDNPGAFPAVGDDAWRATTMAFL